MKIESFLRLFLGWCPGYESASKFVPDREIGSRAVAAGFTAVMIIIIFSPAFNGIFRFTLMVVTAFIGVPAIWIVFREEKAGDQEGTYPDLSVKPTPSESFGEFNIDGPGAEAPVFGPSRSSASYNAEVLINREWLHPDITKLSELQEERRKEAEKKGLSLEVAVKPV